ncbi:MAG: carboxymuconolactone decarboxylase family protein [Gemmatimonadales bacterium]
MTPRFSYARSAPRVFESMGSLDDYPFTLEKTLLDLVRLHASMLNGCAYCIDMHWKDLLAAGEPPQRLYSLSVWPECGWYTARERAALGWTEAVTLVHDGQVPDEAYEAVREVFSEPELCELTLAIATINAWNRLSIASRLTPGTYQPAVAAAG